MLEQILEKLVTAINANTEALKDLNPSTVEPKEAKPTKKKASLKAVDDIPEEPPEAIEEPEVISEPAGKTITQADITALFAKSTGDQRKEIKKVLSEYKASKLNDIDKEDLPDVYNKLDAIVNANKEAA